MEEERIDCFKCRNFYITWNNNRPYGCRLMGFMSKMMPSLEVFRASGQRCLNYNKRID